MLVVANNNKIKTIKEEGWAYAVCVKDQSGLYYRLKKIDEKYNIDKGSFYEADEYITGEAYVVPMNKLQKCVVIAIGQNNAGDDINVEFLAGTNIGNSKITIGLKSIPQGYPKIISGGKNKDFFEILKVYTPDTYIGLCESISWTPIEIMYSVKEKGVLKERKKNISTNGELILSDFMDDDHSQFIFKPGNTFIVKMSLDDNTNRGVLYYGALAQKPGKNEKKFQYTFEYDRKFYIEQ